MNFIRIYFLNGDIEVFKYNLIKGYDQGNLVVIDDSLRCTVFPWSDIFKVEVYRKEVE